tara:strand:+ start:211 stop:468 length:258 start_codon:yes stop_codon:yes gene_type:complete
VTCRREALRTIIENVHVIDSVEAFEVPGDDRAAGNGALILMPAGLGLRLFRNGGGAELTQAFFDAYREAVEMDQRLAAIDNEEGP